MLLCISFFAYKRVMKRSSIGAEDEERNRAMKGTARLFCSIVELLGPYSTCRLILAEVLIASLFSCLVV